MKKYICKYRDGKKIRQVIVNASDRAMAIIGLYDIKNIRSKDIISLKIKKQQL